MRLKKYLCRYQLRCGNCEHWYYFWTKKAYDRFIDAHFNRIHP